MVLRSLFRLQRIWPGRLMKCLLLFFLSGISRLDAETEEHRTLVLIYPPSRGQYISGKLENKSGYTMFNLPIEMRTAVWKISENRNRLLMATGGFSLYFENGTFSSINLSAGLTYTYEPKDSTHENIFFRSFITIYPIYEFPLSILWKSPRYPWKYALDFSKELLNVSHLRIGGYIRLVFFPTFAAHPPNPAFAFDYGLTVGWLF